jgi:serine phosphatase RsbU (regulator of sigma subunit)
VNTELQLVTDRLERLQRITSLLNRAATVGDVVEVVISVLDAPAPAASKGLWLYGAASRTLDLVAENGLPAAAIDRFTRMSVDADLPGAVAYREHRPVTSSSRRQVEEEFEALRGIERSTEGFVAMPLLVDDLCLGVLGLGYDQALAPQDVSFLEAVAGQVAQAVARVRLTDRERRRREELEYLADLTDAALSATDAVELMDNVTAAAVPTLGDWCTLYFMPEGGGVPHISVAHADPAKLAWIKELQQRYPYDPDRPTGVAAVIRSGETEFLPDINDDVIDDAIARSGLDDAEVRPLLDAFRLTSVITVPLLTKRRVVGALQFTSAESGRRYDEDDVALAEAVAGRLAEALDSAWLSDQHREIAVTLQRALLPPRLPTIPGIDITARYWPAGGAEVGGDFYDVFALGSDRWCIVIGDACGTGPNAAALTSIARHTIRAAARHGATHTEVIDWLNQAILLSDRDLFCTSCYLVLSRQAGSWRLESVAAGHPLPIRCPATGPASVVGKPGSLLGAFERVRTSTADIGLDAGDLLVLYTDGVTDLPPPRGLTPPDMLELVESLRDRRSAAAIADGIHESVLQRSPEHSHQDDVAVVVLRVDSN